MHQTPRNTATAATRLEHSLRGTYLPVGRERVSDNGARICEEECGADANNHAIPGTRRDYVTSTNE